MKALCALILVLGIGFGGNAYAERKPHPTRPTTQSVNLLPPLHCSSNACWYADTDDYRNSGDELYR